MRTYILPIWKKGMCLPNALVAAVRFLNPTSGFRMEEIFKGMPIDHDRWLWPAQAALIVVASGCKVKVFDNDINFPEFAQKGLGWIAQKYGERGVSHLKRHFDPQIAVESTSLMLQNSNVEYHNELMPWTMVDEFHRRGDVVICNLDYQAVTGKKYFGLGHYFLVAHIDNDFMVCVDPIDGREIKVTKISFDQARKAMNDEAIDFVVSL